MFQTSRFLPSPVLEDIYFGRSDLPAELVGSDRKEEVASYRPTATNGAGRTESVLDSWISMYLHMSNEKRPWPWLFTVYRG